MAGWQGSNRKFHVCRGYTRTVDFQCANKKKLKQKQQEQKKDQVEVELLSVPPLCGAHDACDGWMDG